MNETKTKLTQEVLEELTKKVNSLEAHELIGLLSLLLPYTTNQSETK